MNILKRIILSTLACSAIWLQGCDQTHVIAGGSDDTHSSLDIQGRVLTQDAKALPNVVVRLRHMGLMDTTGSDGIFGFTQETGFDPGRRDTLDYFRNGEQISSVAVPSSVWMAPDLVLIQRDISGTISGNLTRIRIVTGTLQLPDGTRRTVEFEWIPAQARYSGYAYFVSSTSIDTQTIQIQARDSANRICAQSEPFRFTSRSGSVSIPEFDGTNNIPPLKINIDAVGSPSHGVWVSGNTTQSPSSNLIGIIFPGDTLKLSSVTKGSINTIKASEWSLDGSTWIPTKLRRVIATDILRCDTSFLVPQPKIANDTVTLRFRVSLVDGLSFEDSLKFLLYFRPPAPTIEMKFEDSLSYQHEVTPGTLIHLHMDHLEQQFATATSKKILVWGEGTLVSVSGNDTTMAAPSRIGVYEFRLLTEYSDGSSFITSTGSFKVHGPAPQISSILVEGDSVTISWSDSLPSMGTTHLDWDWSPGYRWTHYDSINLPEGRNKATFQIPTGARSLQLSIRHPNRTFTLRSEIPLPATARTFSGSIIDSSRLSAWGLGVGGFRAMARGAVGEILTGEIARLDWYKEDSTNLDGAILEIQSGAELLNFNDTAITADTLSLDLASPSALELQAQALVRCNEFSWKKPFDTLQWNLAPGSTGHIDLPVSQVWAGTRFSTFVDPWSGPCWVEKIRILATQTTGPRARRGFLEVDNVRWH